eukprot:10462793-Alexandrium_andersonii.AAC.1
MTCTYIQDTKKFRTVQNSSAISKGAERSEMSDRSVRSDRPERSNTTHTAQNAQTAQTAHVGMCVMLSNPDQ